MPDDPRHQSTPFPKLTSHQRTLLMALRPEIPEAADLRYPPVAKLLALGLIESKPQRFGGAVISITTEGVRAREALHAKR